MKYPDYNADVYNLQTSGIYIYEQYKAIDWITKFKDILNNYIQDNYFLGVGEYIKHKNIVYPKGDYVIFYAREYLGIKRPIFDDLNIDNTEEDNRIYGYDVGVLYDVGDIWDYRTSLNPLMSAAMLKKYMSYIMNYDQETWTIDYLMHMPEVILDYFNAIDIRIKWTPHKIYFYMPTSEKFYRRQEITNFISLTKTDNYEMNLPFGDCYEFVQGEHVEGERPARLWYMACEPRDGEDITPDAPTPPPDPEKAPALYGDTTYLLNDTMYQNVLPKEVWNFNKGAITPPICPDFFVFGWNFADDVFITNQRIISQRMTSYNYYLPIMPLSFVRDSGVKGYDKAFVRNNPKGFLLNLNFDMNTDITKLRQALSSIVKNIYPQEKISPDFEIVTNEEVNKNSVIWKTTNANNLLLSQNAIEKDDAKYELFIVFLSQFDKLNLEFLTFLRNKVIVPLIESRPPYTYGYNVTMTDFSTKIKNELADDAVDNTLGFTFKRHNVDLRDLGFA